MSAEQAMIEAAEAVYGGDQSLEGPALIEQLLDRGYRLVACRRQVESFDDLGGWNPTGRLTG